VRTLITERRRTLGVAAALVAAAVTAAVLVSTRSSATPDLGAIGARRLVASMVRAAAKHIPIHGTAITHVDLGLPQLPSTDVGAPAAGPLGALSDISGDHTLRVWASSDGVRVAELLPAAERAVFATKGSLWLWNSDHLTAYRVEAPPGMTSPTGGETPASLTPSALAARALHAIRPTTKVSVSQPTMVAGRPAYALLLQPRTTDTLVGTIEIDVAAKERVPLRVAISPRGASSPALSVGYDSVSFDPIDPSTFRFTPPPGARVKTIKLPGHAASGSRQTTSVRPVVRTFGRGWAEVVAVRIPSAILMKNARYDEIAKLLPYSGPLVSVRLVDHGRYEWLLAGMVPQQALVAAGAKLP